MNGLLKIITYVIFTLISFLVSAQENPTTHFQNNPFQSSKKLENEWNTNEGLSLKTKALEALQNFEPHYNFSSQIPKISAEKLNLFFTKNEFTGMYNVYNTSYGEVRLYQSYHSYFDFAPTCFMPGPVSNGTAGDLFSAVVRSFLSEADLKFKIGKRHTVSFF